METTCAGHEAAMTTNGNGVCTFQEDGHRYFIDGVEALSVTKVLEMAGLGVDYARVPFHILERAKIRGQYVDEACDLLDGCRLDETSLDPTLVPYVEAYRACRRSEPFTPCAPAGASSFQHVVWSKRLGLAGKLDRTGVWSGARFVADLKATRLVSWTYGIQIALYVVLLLLDDGVELGKPMERAFPSVRRKVIQLKDDGTYQIAHYDDPEDLTTAIAALHVARAKQQHGGGGR
jgi:hypothetical protein